MLVDVSLKSSTVEQNSEQRRGSRRATAGSAGSRASLSFHFQRERGVRAAQVLPAGFHSRSKLFLFFFCPLKLGTRNTLVAEVANFEKAWRASPADLFDRD